MGSLLALAEEAPCPKIPLPTADAVGSFVRRAEPLAPPDRWPRFVSVSQTAYVLDCTIDRVRHLLHRRILKGHKLGGEWIVESNPFAISRSYTHIERWRDDRPPQGRCGVSIDSAALLLTADRHAGC